MLDEVQLQFEREAALRKMKERLPPPPPLPVSSESEDEVTRDNDDDENDGDDESVESAPCVPHRTRSAYPSHLRRSAPTSLRVNRRRLRWQSFYNDHQPSFRSRPVQLSSLSAGQVMVLRKLALMKLTTYIAKFASTKTNESVFSWSLTSFMKKMKKNRQKTTKRNVFGISLMTNVQRNGQPLPLPLQYALQYLRRTAIGHQGLFRKSGVKTRISRLRLLMETQPDDSEKIFTKDDDFSPYDIADLVKVYFRELPEPLMTQKLSQTFISIFSDLPSQYRLRAVQAIILLLPDENREVLQTLLYFLSDVASRASENQMPAENLAVCFAPSLFYLQMNQPTSNMNHSLSSSSTSSSRFASLRRKDRKQMNSTSTTLNGSHVLAAPDETLYANKCLKFMINECKSLFKVPQDMADQCRLAVMEQADDCLADEFGFSPLSSPTTLRAFVAKKIAKYSSVVPEAAWTKHEPIVAGVAIWSRDEDDGIPIRTYRAKFSCGESPSAMMDFVLTGRRYWDLDLIEWRKICELDDESDIIHYVSQSMSPHPHRDYCLYRAWRTLTNGTCHLYISSTRHEKAELIGDVRGVVLVSHWIFEPTGPNQCTITHISRFDTRGRGPKWYESVCAHQLATEMKRIQEIFKDSR